MSKIKAEALLGVTRSFSLEVGRTECVVCGKVVDPRRMTCSNFCRKEYEKIILRFDALGIRANGVNWRDRQAKQNVGYLKRKFFVEVTKRDLRNWEDDFKKKV